MRRKNDKFSVLAIIGMASALFATACKGSGNTPFNPVNNIEADVYGPPITSSEDYDPALNIQEDIYGPPEDFMDDSSEGSSSGGISFQEVSPNDTFTPDISGNLKKDTSGDDGEFKPADNIAEPVYGPPAGESEGANE